MEHHSVKAVFLFIWVAMLSFTEAQQLIVGSVADARSGNRIPMAEVVLFSQQDSSLLRQDTTDSQGQFTIANEAFPTFLVVKSEGYEPDTATVPNTRYGGPTGLGKIDMGTLKLVPAHNPNSMADKRKRCCLFRHHRKNTTENK